MKPFRRTIKLGRYSWLRLREIAGSGYLSGSMDDDPSAPVPLAKLKQIRDTFSALVERLSVTDTTDVPPPDDSPPEAGP